MDNNTTKETHGHDDYWLDVKHASEARMSAILRGPVPTTTHELSRALAHIKKLNHPVMQAEMEIAAFSWLQAYHELHEHNAHT